MNLLLVEDDTSLGEGIVQALQNASYRVEWCTNGEQAANRLTQQNIDIVVLDLGLPGMDGRDVLHSLRRRGDSVPVLVLTARDAMDERVNTLDRGADDYLLKPFDVAELLARLRSLLRRRAGFATTTVEHGDLALDLKSQTLHRDGVLVELTRRELALLRELLLNRGTVLTRERLEAALYGFDEGAQSNTLEVYVHTLRKKIGSAVIRTIRGVGYIIESPS